MNKVKQQPRLTNEQQSRLVAFRQAVQTHPNREAIDDFCANLLKDADGEFRYAEEIVIKSDAALVRVLACLPRLV